MASIKNVLIERFALGVERAFGSRYRDLDPVLRPALSIRGADMQANLVMGLARSMGSGPADVASTLVDSLRLDDICSAVAVSGPGFINLKLDDSFLVDQVRLMVGDERAGVGLTRCSETIVIDYSGPNIAKEMHVGHLRSTVIGDAIANILQFQGHRVVRQSHQGDWGTQFGMLIEHLAGRKESDGTRSTIADLNALYAEAQARFDADDEFADRSRRRVVDLQAGDRECSAIWHRLVDESRRHFNDVYARLNVNLSDDDVRGESFYNPMLPETLAELESAGLLKKSDGALCVFLDEFKTRKGEPFGMIVQKKDGGYLYASTDLAAVRFRVRELAADRLLYVTDSRQSQHFASVFAVARRAGWLENTRAEHVPFGAVLGPDRRPLRSRDGGTIRLVELLDEAEGRVQAVLDSRIPALARDDREALVRTISRGAIKYADLATERTTDYLFDWDRLVALDGNTALYVQYAYVRARSVLERAVVDGPAPAAPVHLAAEAERALVLELLGFEDAVSEAARLLQPHKLTAYLYSLAGAFTRFYEQCPILGAEVRQRASRLVLCSLTAQVLRLGLALLGIEVVDRM